jgi:hypothetical protein
MEEPQRGRVGPVHVLERKDERRIGGHLSERQVEALEEPHPLFGGAEARIRRRHGEDVTQLWNQLYDFRELGAKHSSRLFETPDVDDAAERLAERRIWQDGVEEGALRLKDDGFALSGPDGKLSDQAALADAGFPGEKHEAAVAAAGFLETLLQPEELGFTPDEAWARNS